MRALLQRVTQASVRVDRQTVGEIGKGLLIFLAVQQDDSQEHARRLLDKILKYRIFSDRQGKMNLNVQEAQGSLLIVSQFTLAADTGKGRRPSFSSAAPPQLARALYDFFVKSARLSGVPCATGEFAADMQVALVNDGPVTFLLEVPAPS